MSQFLLNHARSPELSLFAHIVEFAQKKVTSISLDSFSEACSPCIRFFFITEGKFNWVIHNKSCTLFPTDLAIVLPGQNVSAQHGYLEIGSLYWLQINLPGHNAGKQKSNSKWSSISPEEMTSIRQIFFLNPTPVLSRMQEAATIFSQLRTEIVNQEIGYVTRINQLIDSLLILIARKLTQQNISHRDFPQTFLKLEEALRMDLSHHWTVEGMAAMVGLGTTAFSDKVKRFTGFSPMNYLINIRISEAIKLLKKPEVPVTDIALTTGFYSSQHFATTFKKLTGYTPSQFRKKNI